MYLLIRVSHIWVVSTCSYINVLVVIVQTNFPWRQHRAICLCRVFPVILCHFNIPRASQSLVSGAPGHGSHLGSHESFVSKFYWSKKSMSQYNIGNGTRRVIKSPRDFFISKISMVKVPNDIEKAQNWSILVPCDVLRLYYIVGKLRRSKIWLGKGSSAVITPVSVSYKM